MTEHTAPVQKPMKPRPTWATRKADTRSWLKGVLRPEQITHQRVIELAPFVYKYHPGSAYQRIAEAMIRNGEIPEYEKVRARHESRKAARDRALAKNGPVELTQPVIDELSRYITTSWETTGAGPSWAQIRTHMEWGFYQTSAALHELAQQNILTFTKEPGSLALVLPEQKRR